MKKPLRRYMNAIMDDDGTRIAVVLGVRNADALIHASNCHEELVNALEQARAALPDAWAAVKCNVPGDVLSLVDTAIASATTISAPPIARIKETLAEHLKNQDNAASMTSRVVEQLRERGDWGRRGYFKQIGDKTGFSPAYVGRVLTGKQKVTEEFLLSLSREFEITIDYSDGGSLPPVETIDEVAAQRDHAVRALTKLLLQSGNPNAFCTLAAMEAREIVKKHDPEAYLLITGYSI